MNDLLLVGSIPLDSAEDVFDTFGKPLGRYLGTLPDGEVGFRRHWISRLHFQVLAIHPDVEVLRYPQKDEGRERLHPRNHKDSWQFRVRDGVDRVRFGEPGWRLGFARDAVNSYFVFRTLKEKGRLPAHLRFQVSLPTPASAVPPRITPTLRDVEILREAYEESLASEIRTIVSKIPAHELAIQWDCATEVQDAYGSAPPYPPEGWVERNTGALARLSPLVPAEARLGFHFCFGTLGGWPRFQPADLGQTVRLANASISAAGRKVDWIHIPLLDTTDDAFFAPLANLEPRGARVYLGAVHNMASFGARVAAARKHFADFGVAAFCGFGACRPRTCPRYLTST